MATTAQSLPSVARSTEFARRALILAALFGVVAVAVFSVSASSTEAQPRFPTDDSIYAVDGWTVSAPTVEGRTGVQFISREYLRADGAQARLNLTTSPQAKLVYRAGADVPFLGNGYSIEAAPADVLAPNAGRTVQIARRGSEAWLQIAWFGERRGVLGNATTAWGFAVFDLILGRANDYYLARVLVPYEQINAANAVQLANTLFSRLASFYA
jgi:hypothetical protein